MLPNPTKTQEINFFREWVNALPKNSYLYTMFASAPDMVEQMIRDDFAWNIIPDLQHRQRDLQDEIKELDERIKEKREVVRTLDNQAMHSRARTEQAKNEMAKIHQQAERLYEYSTPKS